MSPPNRGVVLDSWFGGGGRMFGRRWETTSSSQTDGKRLPSEISEWKGGDAGPPKLLLVSCLVAAGAVRSRLARDCLCIGCRVNLHEKRSGLADCRRKGGYRGRVGEMGR